jgi:NADH-quinone oxidoreductase subunit H
MTAWMQSTWLGYGFGWFLATLIFILIIALPLMLAVAMVIYADRKIWAAMALRRGPNVVGPLGLLQSFADGLKVFLKETIIPSGANRGLFIIAPILTFTVALVGWAVVPFGPGMVLADINVGLLYLLAISSLGVYGVIIAGWASNSKYPFYSALRAAAQMVSYEVSVGFVLVPVILWAETFNLSGIIEAQRSHLWILNGFGFNPLFLPLAMIFLISAMAETARAPFDLTEAESELVAGYQTEYSSMSFALFWLGEYGNVLLMCGMTAVLFWGGWLPPIDWAPLYAIPGIFWFLAKIMFFFFVFSWVKATVPRFRYDQLMRLGWKIFLPISLIWVVLVSGYLMLTRYNHGDLAQAAPTPQVLASMNASDVCLMARAGDYARPGAQTTPVYLYRPRSDQGSDQDGRNLVEIKYPERLVGKYRFVMERSNGFGGSGRLQKVQGGSSARLGMGVTDVVADGRPSAILFVEDGDRAMMGDCLTEFELRARAA